MNSRLLEAVIGKKTLEGGEPGTPEFAERVASSLSAEAFSRSRVAGTSSPSAPPVSSNETDSWDQYPDPLPENEARRLRSVLLEWPKSADESKIRELEALAPIKQEILYRYAIDMVRFTRPEAGFGPGIALTPEMPTNLIEKVNGWRLYQLSRQGMELARLLIAPDPVPEGFESLIAVRERVREATKSISTHYRD